MKKKKKELNILAFRACISFFTCIICLTSMDFPGVPDQGD